MLDLAVTDHITHHLQDSGRQFPEDHLKKAKEATVLKRFATLDVRRTSSFKMQSNDPSTAYHFFVPGLICPCKFHILECHLTSPKLTFNM
jgi:hypothetical protein